MQVDSDHGTVVGIPRCQLCEVFDPNGFRILCGIPKPRSVGAVSCLRSMMIQNHSHPKLISLCHNPVHDFQSTQSLQIRVFAEVNPIGCASSVKQFVTVWQTYGIESFGLHLFHHFDVTSAPQAMRSEIGRLETEPVHACKPHGLS